MMTINYHITSLRVCWKIFRTRGNFNMWTSRAYFKSSKRAPISWNLKVKTPLTLFKMGEAKRCSQTVFPLLICSFTFLPHWCKISRPYLVLVPNYWNQEHLSNKKKFLVKSLQNSGYNNFSYRNAIKLWSHDNVYTLFESRNKNLLMTPWAEILTHNIYFKIPLFSEKLK